MEYIIKFLDFLVPYGMYSYFLMFAVLLACGFGFPMPEDVVLITGGILSARGICDFWICFLVCMAGVLVGDGIVYFMGRHFGPSVKNTWLFKRILSEQNDQRILSIFNRFGDKVIFIGRFTPGLRMPIFMSAGIYRVPPWKFFLLDGFAAIISVPVWIWVGYFFGNNLELLEKKVKQFQTGMYSIIVGLILLAIILWYLKKKFMQSVKI